MTTAITCYISTAAAGYEDDEDYGKLVIETDGEWCATLGEYEDIAGDGDILSLSASEVEELVADAFGVDFALVDAARETNPWTGEREWRLDVLRADFAELVDRAAVAALEAAAESILDDDNPLDVAGEALANWGILASGDWRDLEDLLITVGDITVGVVNYDGHDLVATVVDSGVRSLDAAENDQLHDIDAARIFGPEDLGRLAAIFATRL